jgi:hypothetical protein
VVKRSGVAVVLIVVLLDADRAREPVPWSWPADRVRPKLLAIKVSACHLVLVILRAVQRPGRGRANHRDRVTLPHLPGGNRGSRPASRQGYRHWFDMNEPAWERCQG